MSKVYRRLTPRRPGVTLPEVLVVLFIIGILFALLVPAVQRVRESASRTACANNLAQLTIAVHTFNNATGTLPPYSTNGRKGTIFGGWWISLLPYASETAIYDEILSASTSPGHGLPTAGGIVVRQPQFRTHPFALLRCSSDPTFGSGLFDEGTSNYLANWFVLGDGVRGCYRPAQQWTTLRSGLSNSVLFAEGYSTCDHLTREALLCCNTHNFGITRHGKPSDDPSYLPNNYMMFQVMPALTGAYACDYSRAQTAHTQMPVAFADGSVRFIAGDISLATWTKLMKPRD